MSKLRQLYQFYAENPEKLDETAEKVLWIDESRLSEHLASHSSDYFYWANLYAISKYEVEKATHHVNEVVLVDCRARARQKLAEEKKVRVTKDAVEELALADPAYQKASEQLIKVKYVSSRFAELRQALAQRSDMLQSLNARHCKELNFYGDQDELQAKLAKRNMEAKANQKKVRD